MSYVRIVLPADLKTHIYAKILTEITRGDDTITTIAIDAAIDEVKAYLSRYDLVAMFGDKEAGTSATYTGNGTDYLKSLVKDLTVWKAIKLGNPNLLYENVRNHYEDTIKTLDKIQKGHMSPQGWPFYVAPTDDPIPGAAIISTGNKKRRNRI